MRGFVEESVEVVALRNLKRAAEKFAGQALMRGWGDVLEAEGDLAVAAIAYALARAQALPKPRKRKKTEKKK
jgi:hypothetical protein